MPLVVKSITDDQRSAYEAFLDLPANFEHLTFMHTWEWGEFMHSTALEFERIGIYDDADRLVAVGQLSLRRLKFGRFWYCPRGLVLDYTDAASVLDAYKALRQYYRKRAGAAFLRVDPDVVRGDAAEAWLDTLRPKQAAIFTQAERVWLVDLQQDEASLLEWMKQHGIRKKLPYYLRRDVKAGVTVRMSDKAEDLEVLLGLLKQLNTRKGGIGSHPDDYYRRQFTAMAPKGYEKMFIAEKDGQPLAAALIAIYGKEGSYLHAASADAERDLSAPHTLLFEVMKHLQAKHPSVRRFNFWGIVSDKNRNPSHPRHGYSEFKRSFGGYTQQYIRARDFVYKPILWRLAWLLDRYRTIKNKND